MKLMLLWPGIMCSRRSQSKTSRQTCLKEISLHILISCAVSHEPGMCKLQNPCLGLLLRQERGMEVKQEEALVNDSFDLFSHMASSQRDH